MHSDPSRLEHWQTLYDRGAFLQVWQEMEPLGVPESWTDPGVRVFGGRLLRFLGAQNRGDRLILRTWRRHPQLPVARYHTAWVVSTLRGPAEALQRVREWRKGMVLEEHERADWLCLEAELLSRLRDASRAEERLTEALRLSPSDPWVHLCRGYHAERFDRHEVALSAANEALRCNPKYPHALMYLAHLYQLVGRDEDAVAVLEQTVAETENGAAALQLAGLYDELRRPDDLDRILDRNVHLTPLSEVELRETRARYRTQAAYYRGDFAAAATWARQGGKNPFLQKMADRLGHPSSEWRRVELPVGFVAQHHFTCVPATLTALSQYWKRPVEHLEVSEAICYDGTPSHSERRWAEARGWCAREFRVTAQSAQAVLERGVPFAFTTVYPGGAHEQAVMGFDNFRDTLLIRDPSRRNRTELVIDPGLKNQEAYGPRGLALVPSEEAARLDGLELPEADLYDAHHQLLLALDLHDRATAEAALRRLEVLSSDHRLTWQARRALARYDGDAKGQLAALEALLRQFPTDVNFQLTRLGLLRELMPTGPRVQELRALCEAKGADPLLWYELAWELSQDAREHATALRWLRRASRIRPLDGIAFFLRAQIEWDCGEFDEALENYRLAACLDAKREMAAQAYFRAARWQGRAREALAWLTTRFEQEGRRSSLPGQTLAWAYNELNQTTSAFTALERAVEQRPEDTALRLHVVEEYARWGELRRAEFHLGAAQGPASAADWARAAAGLAARRGDSPESLRHWKAVLEQEPTALDAHRQVADILAQTEGRPAALEHLQSAVARFPFHLPLRQLAIGWFREEGAERWEKEVRDLLVHAPQNAWAQRELGAALTAQQRFVEARTSLDLAALLEPKSPALFNLRGDLAMAEGNVELARRDFEAALVITVDNTWAMRRLLQAGQDAAQRRQAIAFVQQELIRQTTTGEGLLEFAELARPYLTPDELESLLSEAHHARPDLWQTWSALARQRSALGKHAEALSLVEAANQRFPLWPRLWLDRALIHRARLEHAQELEALEKVRELDPSWGWAMRELAQAYYNAGRPTDARDVLTESARRSPLDAATLGLLGEARRKLGDPSGAADAFRAAVRIQPNYDWAWDELRSVGVELHEPDLALKLAEALLARRPNEARHSWLVARLLSGPETRERRLELLDRALTLDTRLIAAHSLRARTLAEAGKWEDAFAACRVAILGTPRPSELVLTEADLRAERGNLDAAIALVREALAVDPGLEIGWRRLAHWLHLRQDFDGAIEASEQLARLLPLDAVPLGYLGDLKERRADRPGAIAAYRRAFELDAQYAFAGLRLFELQREARDLDGAADTVRRLKPHIDEADYLALEVALAVARQQPDGIAAALRAFCLGSTDSTEASQRVVECLEEARLQTQAEAVLRPLLSDPKANSVTGTLWVEVAKARPLRTLVPVLESLGFERPLAICAWQRWMDEVGEGFRARQRKGDLLRWFRDDDFGVVLKRHREGLRASTPLWGKVGFVLICAKRWRAVVDWLDDWRSRGDASPWMLNNLAVGLGHTRKETEFRELVAHILSSTHRDEFTVRFELWNALLALAEDVEGPARVLDGQLQADRLGGYDRILFEAMRVWRRFPVGTSREPLTVADRYTLRSFARSHAREPIMLGLFYRLMRRTAARTSWPWVRLWTAVGPGSVLRRSFYALLILMAIAVIFATRGVLAVPALALLWWLRQPRDG